MTDAKRLNGFFLAILCVFSIVNGGHYTIGNLEVDSPEDGVPSLDTGMYLMSQEFPFDAYIKTVNACAFLTEPNPNPQGEDEITVLFLVAGYRLMDNNFRRITGSLFFPIIINEGETLGCNTINFISVERPKVLKGDRPGVLVLQEECVQVVLNPPYYSCPAHVNIVDPSKNCSQSLYFNNTRLEDGNIPTELNTIDGQPVDVFINLNMDIEPDPPQNANLESLERSMLCASETRIGIRAGLTPIAVALPIVFIGVTLASGIVISMLVCAIVYYKKRKRILDDNTIVVSSIGCDDPVVLQYNTCYSPSNHVLEQHIMEQKSLRIMESTHSYVINSLGLSQYAEVDEKQYWQPASKERDLEHQLKKLKVDEILKDNIELQEYLGSGHFGIVYRGLLTMTGVDPEGGVKEVAVKTMENGASEEERVKFLQEAAIMGQFNNPYVIKIYGVHIASQPYMIICELMNRGDLHQHLHTIKIKSILNQQEVGAMLLSYSRQVASAMMYLSVKGYIHCDLAARNILLSMDGVCKISDFGLSKNLQHEDYYVAKSGLVPLRWSAPEAFQDGKFSTASDVWSYGVVLYEIWSLASKPYGNLTNEQVVVKIVEGHRLPSPPGCPRAIYHKMISCWHPETSDRPTFNDLQFSLQQPDYELLKWSEEDKAMYSENARTIGATFQEEERLFKDMQIMYESDD